MATARKTAAHKPDDQTTDEDISTPEEESGSATGQDDSPEVTNANPRFTDDRWVALQVALQFLSSESAPHSSLELLDTADAIRNWLNTDD